MNPLPDPVDLIDGERSAPGDTLDAWVEDPNTGEQVQKQAATSSEGIERALAAAARIDTHGEWGRMTPETRADMLDAAAGALTPMTAEAAELEARTSGATIGTTGMLSVIIPGAFALAAEMLRSGLTYREYEGPNDNTVEVYRKGWGPALQLVPWNAPAPMAAHKVASALAAGCPVIIKPPERAPHGTGVLAKGLHEIGFEPGLIQLVHGGPRQGGVLVKDPRVRAVSFTGGVGGGRDIATACAVGLKPVQLELGGHSPLVLMPDVDAEAAAGAVVALMTTLNGQWCRALGRLILPAERSDELMGAISAALGSVSLGSSVDPTSMMGPIVHSDHLAMLKGTIDRFVAAGGQAHSWTPLPDLTGNFLAPTLLTGLDPDTTGDEVFGPVAFVHEYRDTDEALALANGTEYGLEAYVFGTDEDAAMALARNVRAGGVKVNGASPISLNLMAPRPAWGVSGLHIEGTAETIEFFCGTSVVGVEGPLEFS